MHPEFYSLEFLALNTQNKLLFGILAKKLTNEKFESIVLIRLFYLFQLKVLQKVVEVEEEVELVEEEDYHLFLIFICCLVAAIVVAGIIICCCVCKDDEEDIISNVNDNKYGGSSSNRGGDYGEDFNAILKQF